MNPDNPISIEKFRKALGPILDVRSPAEFAKGHIPGAVNFPLFSDEQRAEIGTCYKKQGRETAIKLGFALVGPRLSELLAGIESLAADKTVRINCARGGLRSRSVAWLVGTAGYKVSLLEGGYKSYRRWVLETVGANRNISIIGGLTGSGKTRILNALEELGEQVVDLEGLANHRGSIFGGLGMPNQPTTQYFTNLICEKLVCFDLEKTVWVESESGRIGSCWVPEGFYKLMKNAPTVELTRSIEERIDILVSLYGEAQPAELEAATKRIAERLGGQRTKDAIEFIRQKDFRSACRLILDYYDRSYRGDINRRPVTPIAIDIEGLSDLEAAKLLIERTAASGLAARS